MKASFNRCRQALVVFVALLGFLTVASCAGDGTSLIAIELRFLCVDNFNPGGTEQFNACIFIDGVRQPGFDNSAVTWSVLGGDVNGSITQDGFYTAPNTDPPPTSVVTIIATSIEDTQKQGEASIIFVGQGECEAFTTEDCQ